MCFAKIVWLKGIECDTSHRHILQCQGLVRHVWGRELQFSPYLKS